ncbi:MAG: arylesterase [Gammaproteobacteria bacterium]|nr:arylesterase [Gammaproteobacteria bacterium]
MKKFLIAIMILFFTLPALAENTILIVGDSLSAGYGIDPATGWVMLLKQRLKDLKYNYQVVNASISGDTLSNGLSRLPDALTKYKPNITIIELGANDALRGLSPELIKKNLDSLILLATKSGSKVLVLGVRLPPNYGEVYSNEFQRVFQKIKSTHDIKVVPLFLKNVDDKPKLMQADGLHPVTEAQIILLNNVWPALKELL